MAHPPHRVSPAEERSDLTAAAPALLRLLDWLRLGVVVVDEDGAVLHSNPAARAALTGSPAADPEAGGPGTAESRERLERLIAEACRASQPGGARAITLQSETAERPLQLLALSLERRQDEDAGPPGRRPAALLLLHQPDACRLSAYEPLLRDLYRLTQAEARVARTLVEGMNVEEAAAHLGLSRHTVRTHLKHVLAKTGTRSQTELVRMVLHGPLALLGPSVARPPADT